MAAIIKLIIVPFSDSLYGGLTLSVAPAKNKRAEIENLATAIPKIQKNTLGFNSDLVQW